MEKVRRLIDAGASIPTAIKECLGRELKEFAGEIGVHPTTVGAAINGDLKPPQRVIDGLIAEFGGSDIEWRMLLWEAGRPAAEADRRVVGLES